MNKRKKTKVYDWPTRIFHWLFAILFLGAYIIAEFVDDESKIFSYHMLAGITMIFLLLIRIVWGFIGTTYARFSSFKLQPRELVKYLKDSVIAKTKRYLGHNPASSYAAILMFICALGLAVTGILMTSGTKMEFYEESHELFANLFLVTVIIHVGGILFHHLKHNDSLWSSMLDGSKKSLPGIDGIRNTKAISGIILLMLTSLWVGYLTKQYETDTQNLSLFGIELNLGEDHSSERFFEEYENEDD
ncbi:MAG: DUF4405 domain-containing protein [Balneolaceae bacterium]|nr:DUF4405 domain-containing protein [Balneolaceae bacterium]